MSDKHTKGKLKPNIPYEYKYIISSDFNLSIPTIYKKDNTDDQVGVIPWLQVWFNL